MSRLHEHVVAEMAAVEALRSIGEGASSLDEKCQILQRLRAQSPETGLRMDRRLLEEADRLRQGLHEARSNLQEMKQILDRMTAPPWLTAVFLHKVDDLDIFDSLLLDDCDLGERVMVHHGGGRRVVQLAEGLDAGDFQLGDEVLLNQDLTVVLSRPSGGPRRVGETAAFDRYTDDHRLVLRWRDEQLVVEAAAALSQIELADGDLVRLDRAACIAYEKIERSEGRDYFIGKPP